MAARSRIQSASSRLAQPRHGYPENGGAIRNYPQPRTGRSGEEEKSPAQAFEKLGAGDCNRISDLRFTNKLQGVAQVADDLGPTILFPKLSHNPPFSTLPLLSIKQKSFGRQIVPICCNMAFALYMPTMGSRYDKPHNYRLAELCGSVWARAGSHLPTPCISHRG